MIQHVIELLVSFLDHRIPVADFVRSYNEFFRSFQKKPSKESEVIQKDYLSKKITREDFLVRFRLANPGMMDPPLFAILEDLYEDIDAYSPLWLPEEEGPLSITEATLREEAQNALAELQDYLRLYPEP